MEAVSYRVNGMTCGGCVRAVTGAIRASAPGASVAVDLPAGKITVSGLDEAGVRRAVEEAGFDFAGKA